MKFRKKPVVIDAVCYPGPGLDRLAEWLAFCDWFKANGGVGKFAGAYLHIQTLEDGPNGEAKHVATPGDWVIRGVKGEFYPCKPDVFAQTYEPVEEA